MNAKTEDEQPPDEGLVRIYIDKIAGLATKAVDGNDVRGEVGNVVSEASLQFNAVLGTSELSYLRVFAGRLATYATAAESSEPAWADILKLARELVQRRIAQLEQKKA